MLFRNIHWDILQRMKGLLFICAALLPVLANGDVYKWEYESGNIHYSDRPVEKAENLHFPGLQQKAGTAESASAESPKEDAGNAEIAESETLPGGYRQFEILEPEENQTFRTDEGVVSISLLLEPALQEGHELRIELDGNPVEGRFVSTQMMIRHVSRGSHSMRASIVNAEGSPLLSSRQVTFHVRRVSTRPQFSDQ